jgi:hypothetical protein
MKIRVLLLTFIAVFLWGCSTSKTATDKQYELEKLNNIISLIENEQFQFDAEEAFPLQTTAVANTTVVLLNNTGNAVGRVRLESGYFLKLEADSTNAILPFIGEYRGTKYTTANDGNISFNSLVKSYRYKVNTKKPSIVLKFKTSNGTESFDMLLEAFPNTFATLYISSSKRTQIRYSGHIKPLDKED